MLPGTIVSDLQLVGIPGRAKQKLGDVLLGAAWSEVAFDWFETRVLFTYSNKIASTLASASSRTN